MHFCTISIGHRHGNSTDFAHIRALNRRSASVFVVRRDAHVLFYRRVSSPTLPLRKTSGKSDGNSREVFESRKSALRRRLFFFWKCLYLTLVS
nr:unnamed protein product [Callosobruchus chinensis]